MPSECTVSAVGPHSNSVLQVGRLPTNRYAGRPAIVPRSLGFDSVLVILLAVSFGGASLLSLGGDFDREGSDVVRMRYAISLGSLGLIFVLACFTRLRALDLRAGHVLILLWITYAFSAMITAVVRGDLVEQIQSVWMLICVPLLFFSAIPAIASSNGIRIVSLALVLGHAPYLASSLMFSPIVWGAPYRGVFANPNSMGVLGVTIGAGAITRTCICLSERRSAIELLLFAGTAMLSLLLTVASQSMTSFAAMIAMFAAAFLYCGATSRSYVVRKVLSLVAIGLALFSLLCVDEGKTLAEALTEKVLAKRAEGDMLNGRAELWAYALDDVAWCGHGSDYFTSEFGLGAHNSFFTVLGEQGLLPAIPFFSFALISLALSWRYVARRASFDAEAVGALVICVGFWVLSLGEAMFGSVGKGLTLAFLANVGVFVQRRP